MSELVNMAWEPFSLASPPATDCEYVVRWLGGDDENVSVFYDIATFDGRRWRDQRFHDLSDITHCAKVTDPAASQVPA